MAREWRDLFIVDGVVEASLDAEPEAVQKRVGRFRRLRESLRKTRQALQSEIQATLFEELNEETWERLEEALIYADVGAQTTAKVVAQLEREADGTSSAAARRCRTGWSSCWPRSRRPATTRSTCARSRP